MLQLILMLLGLAFSNGTTNTTNCDNNGSTVTTQSGTGTGIDPGTGTGDTGGDTAPTLPPKK
ncbi:hypothetical protein [Chryseobacterium sp. 2R14A]|uniref:hypothetical protein n=1 Tax=Chryseobacterium sp. 2R14A TaxID=3380353 RepID=UPI003CF19DE1